MKKIIVFLFALIVLSGCGSSSKGLPALKVVEGQLCTVKGEPVQLKGVSTHAITRSERRINDEMFKQIHDQWNVEVVRLAMYTEANDSYNKNDYFKEKNLEILENGVEYASKNNMYVIIDWHILSDGNPNKYKQQAIEFFETVSKKYADYSNVLYEICNEPNNCSWSDVKEYANEVIPVIRNNDKDAVILVGTTNWSQDVDVAMEDPLDYDNIMYSFHFYAASHKEDFQERLINVLDNKFPVFVTEYGITANNGGYPRDIESANKWMEILDRYNISSCIWSFSTANEPCSIFDWNTMKTSDITEEDLSETGIWFLDMMKDNKKDNK